MSHNPYDQEFNRLTALLQAVDLRVRESRELYERYDPANRLTLEQAVITAQQKQVEVTSMVEACAKHQQKLDEERVRGEAAFDAQKWSLKGLLNGSSSKLRRACDESKMRAVKQFKDLEHARKQESEARQNVSDCQQELKLFLEQSTYHDAYGEALVYHETERAELAASLSKARVPKEALDQELLPVVSDLNALRKDISALRRDIADAVQLESELSKATDGNERWLVHEKSQNQFNESKPRKVIDRCNKELKKFERSYKKLISRQDDIVRRHTMMIEGIVIDGSNLCYMQGDFIGAAVVVAVADHLAEKCPVTVVFDASIRRKMGMGHDEIRELFSDKVKVHVVATKTKADNLILKEAAGANSWVISNDRFVEFMTEPVVVENRTIRHEITYRAVYIDQLGLHMSLRPDGSFSRAADPPQSAN